MTCTHSTTPGSETAHLRLPSLALLHGRVRSYMQPCSSDDGHARTPGRSPWGAQHGQLLNGSADVLETEVLASGIMDPGNGLNTLC